MDPVRALESYVDGLTDEELVALSPLNDADPEKDGPSFRSRLLVDVDGAAHTFDSVIDEWQRKDFEALDPGWDRVIGISDDGKGFLRAYLERPRGHSKTTDIAVMVLRVLWAADRMLWGYAAAGDGDQAGLMRDAIEKLLKLNPWLSKRITLQRSKVINLETGSWLQIITSDAPSSYGQNPDFIIMDELTHWKKKDLWGSLLSASAKRARCMVCVITNAGQSKGRSWQWIARETCRQAPDWYFSRLEGPVASWITPDRLEAQKRDLAIMPLEYQRLWLNRWTVQGANGLDATDVSDSFVLDGPAAAPPTGIEVCIGGLDLGLKNDHAALVVIGLDVESRKLKLLHCQSWAPGDYVDGEIVLDDIEQACVDVHKRFDLTCMIFDPWQCIGMAQRLIRSTTAHGRPLQMLKHEGAKVHDKMARALFQVFRNRMIDLFYDAKLEDDLLRLQIESKITGYKVTAISDEAGHADRAIALAMTLDTALQWLDGLIQPDDEDETILGGTLL